MKLVRWFVVIFVGILFGVAGWYLGFSSRVQKSIAPVISEADSHRVAELEQEINAVRKNMVALKEGQKKYGQITVTTANTQVRSVPYSATNTSSLNESNNPVSQNAAVQPAPSMEADPASAIKSLPHKFSAEEVDTKWALDHEKKLQEVLYKDVDFQTRELQSVTCKSTTCEVKIKVDKKEDLMRLGSTLNRLLMNKQPNVFDPNMMIKYSELEKTGSFYFSGVN